MNFGEQHNAPTLDYSNLSWIPSRPAGVRLSTQSFANTFRVQRNGLIIDFDHGHFGLFLKPPRLKLTSFCASRSSEGVHCRISLHKPYDAVNDNCKDLYLYLSATATHGSLHGTRHYGAAFMVENRRAGVWNLRYHCSLSFELCWTHHSQLNGTNHTDLLIPFQYATSRHELRIGLGELHYLLIPTRNISLTEISSGRIAA